MGLVNSVDKVLTFGPYVGSVQQQKYKKGKKISLPTSVAANRSRVGCGVATTTTTVIAATATTTAPTAATATTTAITDHFVKTRVNLLLSLTQNGDKVTSLLRV